MNQCQKCNAYIRDEGKVCPLCGSPLFLVPTEMQHVGYPNVEQRIRLMRLLIKIVIFVSVVAEGILVFLDYFLDGEFSWSMITAVGLAFGCFTMTYSFQNNKSLQRKLVVQLIAAIVVLLLLNRIIGHGDWGLSIGVPSAIGAIEIAVLSLLFTDLSHWQIYVMAQVYITVISVVMLVVAVVNNTDPILFSAIAVAFAGVVLAGMLVFGGRHMTNELKRRYRA